MGVVKTKEEALENFRTALVYIRSRYEAGVGKADWLGPAGSDASEANFNTAMTKALAEKRRQKAIRALTNEFWRAAAKEKGGPVIADRIRAVLETKWLAKWGPMYDAVTALLARLPPRGLVWRENIDKRLVPVVEAWVKAAGRI
jgi:hypothetical protein